MHGIRSSRNIFFEVGPVTKAARASLKHQRPTVVWLTGLSGAGKSTIAKALERKLHVRGVHTYLLDGDNLRFGLNRDLGFTEDDRVENIRRAGEVAKILTDAGIVVICAFISPFQLEREEIRKSLAEDEFIEVYVETPIDVCIERDPKKLYKKALSGEIANFTGISSPYEEPEAPELRLDAAALPADELAERVLCELDRRKRLKRAKVISVLRATPHSSTADKCRRSVMRTMKAAAIVFATMPGLVVADSVLAGTPYSSVLITDVGSQTISTGHSLPR